jgi:cytochrome P450
MTTADPITGQKFSGDEMVDQVAIFFLAGHETSASALAWALYLLSLDQSAQARVASEAKAASAEGDFTFKNLSKMPFTRNVFKETLRLYPPVPMMVRENLREEIFRERRIKVGSQIVLSPWHLGRHQRFWDKPDVFDPDRWDRPENKKPAREAFIPFSTGPRVCTGAGFAMVEGVLLLAMLVKSFDFKTVDGEIPIPAAHLTVRARDGIFLSVTPRGHAHGTSETQIT